MKYIVFSNKTKRVVLQPSNTPYTDLTEQVTQCETENIPDKYDYLVVENINENIRVIKKAYTKEVYRYNKETKERETKIIEIPAITEKYLTCDVVAKFYERTEEQIAKQKDEKYGRLTTKYFRLRYDENKVEAIQNNFILYLSDPENPKYAHYPEEHAQMQVYRAECKAKAHAEIYGC